jgi:hypothetical protein
MSIELSSKVAKELRSTGMKASGYKRSPVAGAGFIVNSPRNTIRVWKAERAGLEIRRSKRHNQAVLNVSEDKRTLERNSSHTIWLPQKASPGKLRREAASRIVGYNPLFGAGRRTSSITSTSEELAAAIKQGADEAKRNGWGANDRVRATVKVKHKLTAPKQDFSLLVGIDEVAHFICMLPEKANTVKDAHEMLRPGRLPTSTVRQGEFFFKPATNADLRKINAAINKGLMPRNLQLERSSTHSTPCGLRVDGKLYANACIIDSRTSRHAPLPLKGWHEVVRNREVTIPASNPMSGRTQYWD